MSKMYIVVKCWCFTIAKGEIVFVDTSQTLEHIRYWEKYICTHTIYAVILTLKLPHPSAQFQKRYHQGGAIYDVKMLPNCNFVYSEVDGMRSKFKLLTVFQM